MLVFLLHVQFVPVLQSPQSGLSEEIVQEMYELLAGDELQSVSG